MAVVNENKAHYLAISEALQTLFTVIYFSDCDAALNAFKIVLPALIITDDNTLPRGGRDLAWRIKHEIPGADCAVIVTTNRQDNATLNHPDLYGVKAYLKKPYRKTSLITLSCQLISQRAKTLWHNLPELSRKTLEDTSKSFELLGNFFEGGPTPSYEAIAESCTPLVEAVEANNFKSILESVKAHDDYSYAHSLKVATLLTLFGLAGNLSQSDRLVLATGGLLHDVGKMAIPHGVLNKPGRLTPEEREVMEGHVMATRGMLRCSDGVAHGAIIIAEQHHEKMDGSGYPNGLAGSKLNELARMAAIVDVFSALTDKRVYKPAMSTEKALGIMSDDMPGHFDPNFLRVFKTFVLDAGV
ncbi:MAG: HD domain-containing phosphohydrolase [Rhodospirillaceae bacterium]